MKILVLVLSLFSILVWAEDDENQEIEITDQQRCEEWAAIDGITTDGMDTYIKKCMASLGYSVAEEDIQE